jgi:uncharacterized protein (TIGR03435 family)
MKQPYVLLVLAVIASGPLLAQSNTGKLQFEVASVKQAPPPDGGRPVSMSMRGGPGSKDPGRLIIENFNLRGLISSAYELNEYQLSAPDWIMNSFGPLSPKYNVNATIPEGTTKEQFHVMFQNLLADRFGLVVHHEMKDIQVYDLVVAKNGPKIKHSAADPAPEDDRPSGPPKIEIGKDGYPVLPKGTTMAIMRDKARMNLTNLTMDQFAQRLSGQLGRPVHNATNLTGQYDIEMFWLAGNSTDVDSSLGPTLEQALQDQAGLKLESKKGQVDVVVVDHAEKTLSENQ